MFLKVCFTAKVGYPGTYSVELTSFKLRDPPTSTSQGLELQVYICSMNNKNPETDIEVQPEDQKSKAFKPLQSSYF